jgi:hypothetical protein
VSGTDTHTALASVSCATNRPATKLSNTILTKSAHLMIDPSHTITGWEWGHPQVGFFRARKRHRPIPVGCQPLEPTGADGMLAARADAPSWSAGVAVGVDRGVLSQYPNWLSNIRARFLSAASSFPSAACSARPAESASGGPARRHASRREGRKPWLRRCWPRSTSPAANRVAD